MKAKTFLLATWAAFCILGCSDDFLDLAPISNASTKIFYKSEEDFDLAKNAAYATLYDVYGPEGGPSYTGELMSDNATLYHVLGIASDKWAFRDYTLNPTNTIVYDLWQRYYQALYDINNVISKLENSDVSDTYKNELSAEMKFLRALYYFNMVQSWGAVPIVTEPVTAAESYNILRSPESEVYDLIISDLNDAVTYLPNAENVANAGDASKGAALTLLGKAYLTMGDKSKAASTLLKVYDMGYQLLDDYAELWNMDNKNSEESIFEIQYLGGISNPYSQYWSGFSPTETFSITQQGKGMNQVTDDLYEEYEEGDPRRNISIFTGYTDNSGQFIPIKFAKKWVDMDAPLDGGTEAANNNFIVLRYADVLLMLSEATGDPKYLNEVRGRVGLPLYGTSEYPSDKYPTLDLAIEHERRVELALEFYRWYDLKRTGRVLEVLKSKDINATENQLLLPIPEIVRQQNPDIAQNPGY